MFCLITVKNSPDFTYYRRLTKALIVQRAVIALSAAHLGGRRKGNGQIQIFLQNERGDDFALARLTGV
jgi:hypothetical protein